MLIKPAQQHDELLADIRAASNASEELDLWWLGQSGFLVKCGESFLLLDPYLSDSLTKKYANSDKPHVRMTELVIAPAKLDMVRVVTSSHQHTDHFDEETLRPLVRANSHLKVILPEAAIAAARRRLPDAPVEFIGLDDGRSIEVDGWHFTGLASAHNEVDRDEEGHCRYLGFIIRRNGITIYHSGDTLWHDGLVAALRDAHCDLMLLPINGNKPERRVAGNLNGTEAAALARACNARLVVPCHYEMFEFNTETTDEFVAACERLAQPFHLMRAGSRLTIGKRC